MPITSGRSLVVNGQNFRDNFHRLGYINEGAEGKVSRWQDKKTGELVAVKEPIKAGRGYSHALVKEIKAFTVLKSHPNIVNFLGYDEYWAPNAPAVFIEHADYGDLQDFGYSIRTAGLSIPEMTLWKLLLDMSKALYWIHKELEYPYVHGDIKPSNILVMKPANWPSDDDLPILPTFKLCDVSRLVPYRKQGPVFPYFGTPEYAPPRAERRGRVAPPVDIYAVGATIQSLALGQTPIMSKRGFIDVMKKAGCIPPTEKQLDGYNHKWRQDIPIVYRPLNASEEEQKTKWSVKKPQEPYSNVFNEWYTMMMRDSSTQRVTAKILHDWYIPLAKRQIKLLILLRSREAARQQVEKLKAKYTENRASRSQKRGASAPSSILPMPTVPPRPRRFPIRPS